MATSCQDPPHPPPQKRHSFLHDSLNKHIYIVYELWHFLCTSCDIRNSSTKFASKLHSYPPTPPHPPCDPKEGSSSRFNKLVWPPVRRSHPLNAAGKKGKVDKQSDGKSHARETKRAAPFILLCQPCPPPLAPFLCHTPIYRPLAAIVAIDTETL